MAAPRWQHLNGSASCKVRATSIQCNNDRSSVGMKAIPAGYLPASKQWHGATCTCITSQHTSLLRYDILSNPSRASPSHSTLTSCVQLYDQLCTFLAMTSSTAATCFLACCRQRARVCARAGPRLCCSTAADGAGIHAAAAGGSGAFERVGREWHACSSSSQLRCVMFHT
jgi:hypothetical protein